MPVTELMHALLVTAEGPVVAVPGAAAVAALQVCHRPEYGEVLPATALGLAAECWSDGDLAEFADSRVARVWLQLVVGEVEATVSAQVSRRFEAAHTALRAVVADAVHAGILPP
jgi:hypothetical protein